MNAYHRLRAMLNDPEFLRDYNLWLENPVTRHITEAAKELARPAPLGEPTRPGLSLGDLALVRYGELQGVDRVVVLLTNAVELCKQLDLLERFETLEPTYDTAFDEKGGAK